MLSDNKLAPFLLLSLKLVSRYLSRRYCLVVQLKQIQMKSRMIVKCKGDNPNPSLKIIATNQPILPINGGYEKSIIEQDFF